ncbi:hypothetical protein FZEAL_8097 [Fusarium zealandicum]|uniref:Uncharacterized protein n=1 Tax=Fusarium zealandicum TaxID=1053134 RepID=A0A8H4XHU4_9HYPO|nr:hypothetical protein FZEAL_8097 [Fusarium zealandicum]
MAPTAPLKGEANTRQRAKQIQRMHDSHSSKGALSNASKIRTEDLKVASLLEPHWHLVGDNDEAFPHEWAINSRSLSSVLTSFRKNAKELLNKVPSDDAEGDGESENEGATNAQPRNEEAPAIPPPPPANPATVDRTAEARSDTSPVPVESSLGIEPRAEKIAEQLLDKRESSQGVANRHEILDRLDEGPPRDPNYRQQSPSAGWSPSRQSMYRQSPDASLQRLSLNDACYDDNSEPTVGVQRLPGRVGSRVRLFELAPEPDENRYKPLVQPTSVPDAKPTSIPDAKSIYEAAIRERDKELKELGSKNSWLEARTKRLIDEPKASKPRDAELAETDAIIDAVKAKGIERARLEERVRAERHSLMERLPVEMHSRLEERWPMENAMDKKAGNPSKLKAKGSARDEADGLDGGEDGILTTENVRRFWALRKRAKQG